MRVETFSTRIKGHTLESFLAEVRKLRPMFLEAAQAAWNRDVVRFAAAMSDVRRTQACLDCNPNPYMYDTIESARKELGRCYERGETSYRRQQLYKYGVTADVYPLEGQLLVVFHVDHPVLQQLLMSQPWWEDVSYPWASWDPKSAEDLPLPEGLTFEAWKERELLWRAAMQVDWPAGYQVTILRPDQGQNRATDEMLVQYLPTLDERVSLLLAGMERSLPGVQLPPNPTREQWDAIHGDVFRMYLLPELSISELRREK
jgi:hypothetical protein